MAEEPFGHVVVITAREIYEAVVRLTGRVDVAISQQADAAKDLTDHEQRIRALERARWPLPSIGVLIAVLSLIIAVIRS